MLDRGPDLSGAHALPRTNLLSLLHTLSNCGPFGVNCWSKGCLLKGHLLCMTWVSRFKNKREQKCRKRNAHIKVIQIGLKSKHQTTKSTGILPAVAYGHAGMGMCPSSIQHKRTVAADSCGKRIKTACTTTILHFHFGRECGPRYLVSAGPASDLA